MVTNAAETSAPQDFYVDNTKINSAAMAYGQSTTYFMITGASNTHQADFRTSATGTVNNAFGITLNPGGYYTLFYTDDKTVVGSEDDNITQPLTGQARVRFVNLSSAVNSSVDFAIIGGAKVVTGLPYKTISDYYGIAANSNFTLSVTGSSTTLLNIPANIQAGHTYIIYITGTTTATVAYHLLTQI
jgi:hypothetical protein